MKTLKAIKASLASLVIGLSASAFAGYDAEGGYVTLGIDEYSGSSGVSSLTTAGAWSDGRAPHSDTNYYAAGLGYYPGVFQGGRLVVRKLRPRGTPVSPQGSTGFTWEQLEANAVQDCIMCGCCLYSCPAGIPLLDVISQARGQVMGIMRARAAAAKAAAEAKPKTE